MKKIYFSDRFGLTQAVLEGRKTMTRRLVSERCLEEAKSCQYVYYQDTFDFLPLDDALLELFPFKVGEVVAVAQNLRDMGYDPRDIRHRSGAIWGLDHTPAWTNKMFVSASECIHQIRITSTYVKGLQNIFDEDCIREGIVEVSGLYGCEGLCERGDQLYFNTPRAAFAALIDKISGIGTWESDPYCFVYEFELIK